MGSSFWTNHCILQTVPLDSQKTQVMSPLSPNNRTCFDQVSRQILKRHHSAKAMTRLSSSSTVARARTATHDGSSTPIQNPTFIPRQRSISYTGTVKRAIPRPYPRALSPAFPHFGSRSLQTMVNTSSLDRSSPGTGRFIRQVKIAAWLEWPMEIIQADE